MIQGFGNVGSNAARLMRRRGYKIVGVSTSKSGVYNRNGIDVDSLWEYHQEHRTLAGFPGANEISSADLLVADCDILIPAAVENQITTRNADRVKAKILCEGANGPTTAEADEILSDKRVFVIPDILANSGGVTVSYFEWVQDRQGYFWTEAMVNDQLENTLCEPPSQRSCSTPRVTMSATALPPTCWPSIEWLTPFGNAESTPKLFSFRIIYCAFELKPGKLMATTSLDLNETAMLVSRSNFPGSTLFPESPFAPPEKGAYRHSEIAFAAATASDRLPVKTMTRLTDPSEPTIACIRTFPRAFVLGQPG